VDAHYGDGSIADAVRNCDPGSIDDADSTVSAGVHRSCSAWMDGEVRAPAECLREREPEDVLSGWTEGGCAARTTMGRGSRTETRCALRAFSQRQQPTPSAKCLRRARRSQLVRIETWTTGTRLQTDGIRRRI